MRNLYSAALLALSLVCIGAGAQILHDLTMPWYQGYATAMSQLAAKAARR